MGIRYLAQNSSLRCDWWCTQRADVRWRSFIGFNSFCHKACDPAGADAAHFCEHIYDRIGCAYNAPNRARDRVFESCAGDSQDFPGVYTAENENGSATLTYRQPAESLGAITSVPYTARVPASSSCQVYESAALYTGLPSAVVVSSTTGAAGAGAGAGATGATGGAGSARPGAKMGTAAAAQAQATSTSGAAGLVVSGCAVVGGVLLLSAVLLA
ncbi:hypothetical protein BJ912DRAFT_326900 [Pholiota molesta]|nr:hypothetical protein BJ912DRAFT_326900 [Pholiota molesta]